MFKRYVSIIASILLAVTLFVPLTQASVNEQTATFNMTKIEQTRIDVALEKVTDYMLEKPIESEWQAVGLAKAGITVPAGYKEVFYRNVQQQLSSSRLKITDAERLTLAAVAIGEDPYDVDGFNLLDFIYNSRDIKEVDTMTRQGTNGLIFALIALDSNNFEVPNDARWNRDKIVDELLKYQLENGGWSLSTSSTGSVSYDMTAMALIGLAPYTNQPEVSKAVDRAANFLSEEQGPTGGFDEEFVGGISSEATSQVIIGLTANNIDPQDEMFTKNGTNLIDHLLSFQTETGGFKHTTSGDTDGMATEQAVQALVAYDLYTKNEGALYDFTNTATQFTPKVTEVGAITSLINGSLLKVQKAKNGTQSSIFIEETEYVDGYFIVRADETSKKKFTTIPREVKEVFIVENDRPYKSFDAETVSSSHMFTITFNKEIQDSKENLDKIYVEDVAGKRVPVTIIVNGSTATVTPETNYASGQLYSLVVIDPVSTEGKVLKQAARKLFIIE